MTILRSGATQKYSDNWAKAFGDSKKKSNTKSKQSAKKSVKKQTKSKKS
jgi:hypothetical protein